MRRLVVLPPIRKTSMTNPILPGFYPDPSVCVVDGRYYLANSSFEYSPGIPLHVSEDFENWRPIGHAIDRAEQLDLTGAYDSGGLYAPSLRHHRGTFYIACTVFTEVGAGTSFYLTATDPAGDWSAAVVLPDARGFDPSLFFDGDRAWWLECREKEEPRHPGDTEIWIRELDLARRELVGPEHIIGGAAMAGGIWAEGPHVVARDGWYYLVTAEGGTEFNHAAMVARSREVTGPYDPYPRNPLITHRHLGQEYPVRNVGHADLVEGVDGRWRAALLGSRQVDGRVILGRETFSVDVEWEDGWPVVNPGFGLLRDVATGPLSESADRARLADFLTIRGAVASEDATGVMLPPTGLWRRLRHHHAGIEVSVELLDPAARVSLVLRQSDSFQLVLRVQAERAVLIERRAGVDVNRAACDFGGSRLRADISDSGVRFSVDDEFVGEASVDVLSTEIAGGFVGTMFGARAEGAARLLAWSYDGR